MLLKNPLNFISLLSPCIGSRTPRCLEGIGGHRNPWDTVTAPSPLHLTPLLCAQGLQSWLHVLLTASEHFLFPEVSFAENLIVPVAAAGLEAFPHPNGVSSCWDIPDPNEPRGSCVSPDQERVLPR